MNDDLALVRSLYQYTADVYGIKLTEARIDKLIEYNVTPYEFEQRARLYSEYKASGDWRYYLPPRRAQRFRRLRAWMRRVREASSSGD